MIKDVIIRKGALAAQEAVGFQVRIPHPTSQRGHSAGIAPPETEADVADRVAVSNSRRLQMTVPLLRSARAPAGICSENEIEHGLRLPRRCRL
jgi:hypothetical protein